MFNARNRISYKTPPIPSSLLRRYLKVRRFINEHRFAYSTRTTCNERECTICNTTGFDRELSSGYSNQCDQFETFVGRRKERLKGMYGHRRCRGVMRGHSGLCWVFDRLDFFLNTIRGFCNLTPVYFCTTRWAKP